jgi:hypothetical protein
MSRRKLVGYAVALVAGLSAGVGVPLAASAADPVEGQWHLDDASTNSDGSAFTPDSSGHGRDLGAPAFFPVQGGGRFGSYLGTTNGQVLTFAGGIRPTQVTVLAWVKSATAHQPGADEVIAEQAFDDQSCNTPSYRLGYHAGDSGDGLEFSAHVGGSVVSTPVVGTPSVWNGAWHLVAGTFDGSKLHLNVDGNEVSSAAATGSIDYGTGTGFFGVQGFTGNDA